MKKIILIIALMFTCSVAKTTDYSEMSTQELIAIMGYVKAKEEKIYIEELKSRVPTMNSKEKTNYKKNLNKIKR